MVSHQERGHSKISFDIREREIREVDWGCNYDSMQKFCCDSSVYVAQNVKVERSRSSCVLSLGFVQQETER